MKVIVFGSTGAIGQCLIEILSRDQPKWEIFAVTRSLPSDVKKFDAYPNVQVTQGDPNDKESTLQLSADKDIVYSCVGFPRYEAKYWAKHWPPLLENLLAASSQRPDQKFVFCDNLYAYGATTNISPTSSPIIAKSWKSKPGVRAHLRGMLQKRMDEDPKSIVAVGGADFFGPHVTNLSFLGDTFTKAIVEGKPAPICIGSKTAIHDFCYTPDLARALYLASIHEEAMGRFWICPHAIHGKSFQDIANCVARLAGGADSSNSKNSKVTCYPGWSVRLLSPFMGFMSEMVEMLPFWSKDYTVDDSDFIKTFGVTATPYEAALRTYIQMYCDLQNKDAVKK